MNYELRIRTGAFMAITRHFEFSSSDAIFRFSDSKILPIEILNSTLEKMAAILEILTNFTYF